MSKNSCCNLCLSADKPTKGIFNLGLQETILFVCDVQIKKNISFPSVICEECERKLYQFQEFKTTAQESYKGLQNSHCNRVDPIEELSTDRKVHLLEIQILEPCDQQLQAHVKHEVGAESVNQTETEESQLFVSISSNWSQTSKRLNKRDPLSLKRGKEKRKKYSTKASLRVEPRSIFAGHECKICEKIFVTKKCLSKHAAEHTKNTTSS